MYARVYPMIPLDQKLAESLGTIPIQITSKLEKLTNGPVITLIITLQWLQKVNLVRKKFCL